MNEPVRISSLIAGKSVAGGDVFRVPDRYTGVTAALVHEATEDHARLAVAAGADAFAAGAPPPYERHAILSRAGALLESRRAAFVEAIVTETGFTVADASNEVSRAIVTMSLCAEEARRLVGETVPMGASPGGDNRVAFTMRMPIGVVCAITPFNSPLNTVLHKVGPALAAGNAVILKPSGHAPITADLLGRVLLDAGLPVGLLSILHGLDARVAQMLLGEQAVQFYAFTGRTSVGQAIQAAAGLRRTQLELGSVASTIVCADADLDRAVPRIANAAFRKAGQVCTSVQSVYIDRTLSERLTERLVAEACNMLAGDPRDPRTRVGPMISEREAMRAESWISEAREQQARILCGGTRSGAVMPPTVLTNVRKGMKVLDEEIFAPVVSIVPFDALEMAIEAINAGPFGLSVGVFTESTDTGLRAARRLRFGAVHLNETSSVRADGMPFGGVKHSGFGKEGPRYAICEMTEERLVTFNLR